MVALVYTRSGECYSVHAWRLRISWLRLSHRDGILASCDTQGGGDDDDLEMGESSWTLTPFHDEWKKLDLLAKHVRSQIVQSARKNGDSMEGLQMPECAFECKEW